MKKYLTAGALLLILTDPLTAEAPTQLPALTVVSTGVPGENKMVGEYAQPEWSARRPFPGVSVYVQPGEQFELETTFQDESTPSVFSHRKWSQEFEAGLGHRWQVAVENTYATWHDEARRPAQWHEDSCKVSTRYALADWGKLPLNPALGVGWHFNSGVSDAPSCQLVLGAEFTPRLHWAADAYYERQTGDSQHREWNAATALTYSVTNETLNVGVQAQWKRTLEIGEAKSERTAIGPCIQYRPRDQLHLDGVVLWGTERSRYVHAIILSAGFEFGQGADDHDDDRERAGRMGR